MSDFFLSSSVWIIALLFKSVFMSIYQILHTVAELIHKSVTLKGAEWFIGTTKSANET